MPFKKALDPGCQSLSAFNSLLQIPSPKQVNWIKDLDNGYPTIENKFSFLDFKEYFNLLESNSKESNLKTLPPTGKPSANESLFACSHAHKLRRSQRGAKRQSAQNFNSNKNSFKDTLFSKPLDLKQNSTFVSPNESKTGIQFSNKKFFIKFEFIKKQIAFFKKKQILLEWSQFNLKSFTDSDQTWIHLLTKIFTRPFLKKKNPLYF